MKANIKAEPAKVNATGNPNNKNKSVVNYMAKEFEMKKAASAYNKSQQAKTGELNMDKLHLYKIKDDISTSFHSFWNKGKDDDSLRFLNEDNIDKMKIRLFWVESLRIVFKNSFDLIGIQSPESM